MPHRLPAFTTNVALVRARSMFTAQLTDLWIDEAQGGVGKVFQDLTQSLHLKKRLLPMPYGSAFDRLGKLFWFPVETRV